MLYLIFVAFLSFAIAQNCDIDNCQPPDCRCYSSVPPGDLPTAEIPQMVVITMDYSLNQANADLYNELFAVPVANPNSCPLRGTFFIQDQDTDYGLVKSFYDQGFEAGINSLDGQLPTDSTGWIEMITAVKDKLVGNDITEENIFGYRAPELTPGGSEMFIGIIDGATNLMYDASCVTNDTLGIWPFTYDFIDENAKCNFGSTPIDIFPGKWQVLLPEFSFGDEICATPEGCTGVETEQDAFDILYNNFAKHYEGSRTPYVITIDASWMTKPNKLAGTKQFLEYVLGIFDDVWVVTAIQALRWIQEPTPIANLPDFAPWQCPQPNKA